MLFAFSFPVSITFSLCFYSLCFAYFLSLAGSCEFITICHSPFTSTSQDTLSQVSAARIIKSFSGTFKSIPRTLFLFGSGRFLQTTVVCSRAPSSSCSTFLIASAKIPVLYSQAGFESLPMACLTFLYLKGYTKKRHFVKFTHMFRNFFLVLSEESPATVPDILCRS